MTACAGWSRPSTAGSLTGTRTRARSAGPNRPPKSNAASAMLHLFTRQDTIATWPENSDFQPGATTELIAKRASEEIGGFGRVRHAGHRDELQPVCRRFSIPNRPLPDVTIAAILVVLCAVNCARAAKPRIALSSGRAVALRWPAHHARGARGAPSPESGIQDRSG